MGTTVGAREPARLVCEHCAQLLAVVTLGPGERASCWCLCGRRTVAEHVPTGGSWSRQKSCRASRLEAPMTDQFAAACRAAGFTARETEIAWRYLAGQSATTIAAQIGFSSRFVRKTVTHIYAKLRPLGYDASWSGLVAFAKANGYEPGATSAR